MSVHHRPSVTSSFFCADGHGEKINHVAVDLVLRPTLCWKSRDNDANLEIVLILSKFLFVVEVGPSRNIHGGCTAERRRREGALGEQSFCVTPLNTD